MLLLSQHFRITVVFSFVISPHAPGRAEDTITNLCSLAWGAHPAANLPSLAHQLWRLLLGQLGRTFLPALPSSYPGEGSSRAGLTACVKPAAVCGVPSQGTGRVKPTRCIWLPSPPQLTQFWDVDLLPSPAFHLGCEIPVSLLTAELQD